jgi:hypothetical protein
MDHTRRPSLGSGLKKGADATMSAKLFLPYASQPFERSQNGNGLVLQKVGTKMRLAPHPLGAGASLFSVPDRPAYTTGPTTEVTTKDSTIPQAITASA